MIIVENDKGVLSFSVYSLGVFACLVLILDQDHLGVSGYTWVPCVDTFGYYGKSITE